MSGILVAGLGNIFKRDDAFGVEVARRLSARAPEGAKVVDFGVRGLDLVYALLDDYDAAILVDVIRRGGAPGDLYVIEPETESVPEETTVSGHELDPVEALKLAAALGGKRRRVLLVACEPLTFGEEEDESFGLSEPVAASIDSAVDRVAELLRRLRNGEFQ